MPSDGHRNGLWYWIAALGVVIIVGVALGLYFGLAQGGGDDADGAVSATTSTTTVTSSAPDSTTSSTVGSGPVASLDRDDSGTQVKFRVGERVLVEMEPWVGDKVTEVIWEFRPSDPNVVRIVDSGSEVEGGVVVRAWLELEGAAAGPVTLRANYEYPNGTAQAKFVAYLIVLE
jgi:hypothetical protein